MRVVIGADHGGFSLKGPVAEEVRRLGHEVVDVGAHEYDPGDDYPDFALALALTLVDGEADRGILICGSGVGACVAAGKVPGIRASLVMDGYSAHQGVEHDDMNVLCLGARVVGVELALDLVRTYLASRFSGEERHRRRLGKIDDIRGALRRAGESMMDKNPLWQLQALGQSVWYDNIGRGLLQGGGLQRLIDEYAVVGVTSNPTIFQKAVAESDDYDPLIRESVEQQLSTDQTMDRLMTEDVARACDILRPVFDREQSDDGWVSIEVKPSAAHDADVTLSEVHRLRGLVDRPNLLVKIPATKEGVRAIQAAIGEGIPINVTLIFSLERYGEVMEAYLAGLESLLERQGSGDGLPALEQVASVASLLRQPGGHQGR